MNRPIFENKFVKIYKEDAHIPWYKIFTADKYKELTDCPKEVREKIYYYIELLEGELRAYYEPDKINISMFGNYLPHLHVHIMARFKEDGYFPETLWGKKQKEPELNLPNEELFLQRLIHALNKPI